MSSGGLVDPVGEAGDVLSIIDERAGAVAGALASAYDAATGALLHVRNVKQMRDLGPRTLTLELIQIPYVTAQAAPAQTSGGVTSGATGAASASAIAGAPQNVQLKTIASAAAKAKPASAQRHILSLDIVPTAPGWPQRLSYKVQARQSIQQTAAGFSILEWGFDVGQIDIDCLVGLGPNPPKAVAGFFDLLYKAKRTRPLAGEYPWVLRFHDTHLGRSFIISQEGCELQETADMQNVARLLLRGRIVWDYANTGKSPTSSLTAQSVAASEAQNVLSDMQGLLDLG